MRLKIKKTGYILKLSWDKLMQNIKKIFKTLVIIAGLMAFIPAFGMDFTPDNPCTQCRLSEAKAVGGIGHTTNLTALLSLQLPFKRAHHNLCDLCEGRIQNIHLSPLQSLGCKHCYLQKNPYYDGCSTLRFWGEVALIAGVISYTAYKVYQWWKDEEAQENDADDTKDDQKSQK